ncbi:Transmembrane protease serine 3, partial [Stegodyphus mimosarum]
MCLTGINKWFLAGTLTYQRFCDVYSKHPAVFSNLFSMRKFVDQVIGQKQYETPYNSSMYVIIPPTTPSPIVPETTTALPSTTEVQETTTLETTSTTLEMTGTTPETTASISDSTPVITSKLSENLQDTMTEFTEEFRSEENITAAFEITANYSTSADDVIYVTTTAVNTDILEFGVENSTTRPMFSEDEILSNDSVTDKTHDSLMMSFLNETYADSEANATEISIFENGTSLYDNDTSSVLEEITSTPNPLTTHDELSDFTTESSNLTSVDSNEKSSSDTITTSDIDEAKTNTMTTETFTLPKESTDLTTSMVSATLTENLKIESTTSSYKEEFVNPDSKATTLEMKTEPEHREKFEFELTEEPDTDMTFALFSDVDGIKLETEKASENLKLSNISKEYVPRSRNLEEQPFINASDIFYEPIPTIGVPYDPNTTIFSSDGSFKEQPFINVSDIFEPIAAANMSYDSDATLLPESRNHEKLHLIDTTHLTESYNLTEQSYTDAYDTLHESITTTEISHNSETTHLTSSSYTEEKPHTSNMDIVHDSTFATDNLPNSEITHSTTSQNLEQPDINTSYVFYEPLSTTDIPYDSEPIHLPRNESFELPHENISDISDMQLSTTKIPSALETTQVMTTVQDTSVNISGQDTVDVTAISLITTSIKTDTTTAVFDTTQDVNTTEPYSEDPTFITTASPAVTSDIAKDVETASDSNTQIFKDHLISEKLQILEKKNFTAYDTEECGMWDQDSNVTVTSEQFFMKWPALGFLQMVSHPKMCASSILSPHFVITSLSCLSFRDNQLNPDKWAYIGGLYDESSSISGTQSHLVSKIIPYPNRNPPLLFNENDLALVQVKDEIKLDRFSKNVCLPYDKPQTGQECFISGWKKSSSDDDQGREFLSIPVSIISNEECNNTANYNGMLLESLICSMNNNESFQACQMDIGSPLFCLGENERWEIQGILNFPSPCDMTQPAVFNSIYSIREWAIEIVRNETTYTSFSED